ncbi:DUF305 domain-containing protein [Actinoalloteichus hymeniacidonis]|uniref:DUF305 domain-containing protein n=1 Tax=Actinoalloteichus hymeniacidonis TaxID=340345 RepID=UPI0012F8916A|nr:DUF305 domain-containing protein [Actinoalloteichus hymeniacidonis]MBB5909748.1 uncharacterized protein (DUF305 family) [Actinoalloteichus hymeniacidonis]
MGLLFLGLAGCTGGSTGESATDQAAGSNDGAPVIMPGAPGDEPRDATESELAAGDRQPVANAADTMFVEMMIPHHEQAGVLTELVPDRSDHRELTSLADRISDAQGAEIGALEGWLDLHDAEATESEHGHGHAGHGEDADAGPADHADMPGMATEEQLAELAELAGVDFDRMFLELMIVHHEGAVTMAEEVLSDGADVQVVAMAQDVLVTQVDEIETMRRLLTEL